MTDELHTPQNRSALQEMTGLGNRHDDVVREGCLL
jgi:hypothetical protein